MITNNKYSNKNIFLILFVSVFCFVSAQEHQTTIRPKVIVKNKAVFEMIDTALTILTQNVQEFDTIHFFKLFEMECEGAHRCWMECRLTNDILRYLNDEWNDRKNWPEGYFFYKNTFVFVQSDLPGLNIEFTDEFDEIDISQPHKSSMSNNQPTLIISTITPNGYIVKPYYITWM